MTPERWRDVTKILGPALERTPEERRAYLDAVCVDVSLRQEVEALIAAYEQGDTGFLESAAVTSVPLETGRRLGDYTIVAPIGAGGMGEVYRARDTRLNRDVALKVLPAFVAAAPDRLQRFEREARAAAALNHPNILTVFQMGTEDTTTYLVSELLDGSTLREQLKHGPLPLRKAIDFGIQIARGLAAAHEKKIVHRDVKPENLFVTTDGRVKILDFGLAKLTPLASTLLDTVRPAVTLTAPGAVLGTVGYMAPEQASGRAADHRTDIFAFGAVLYEMLGGTRAFERPTPAETLSAILNEDPPALSLVVPASPLALQKVVSRCLEKSPEQRFQSASDLAFALEALSSSSGAPAAIARPASHRAWRWVAAACVVALLGLGASRYLTVHRTPPVLTEKDSIVLAEFTNRAHDEVFDGTLRQGLSVQLEQTPFLRIASTDQIAQALREMEKPPDTPLTHDIAREVCQRAAATIDVEGSIALLGSQYVIGLTALNCQTGETVAQEQATATRKDAVLAALTTAASDLRSKLGESRPSLNRYGVALAQATTSSLPALQAFSRGAAEFNLSRFASAAEHFERAVTLDPNFAEAYALMGTAHAFIAENRLAARDVTKSYALRDRVSEFERLFITANYYLWGTRDLERALKADQIWTQTYPRDPRTWPHLAYVYRLLGRNDEALETGLTSVRLDPASVPDYTTPILVYMRQGRIDDATAIVREAQAHQAPGWPQFFYSVAFLRHDASGMAEQAARIGPGRFQMEASTAAYDGQLARARESSRQAIAFATQSHANDDAAVLQANAALREALFGNAAAARAAAATVISPQTHETARSLAALSLALAHDDVQPQKIADDLQRQFPDDTFIQFYYLPSIRAALALESGKPDQAIESLLAASSYDLAVNEGSPEAFVMLPVYLRGTAYLSARRGSEAAAEFQKILDRPGLMLNCPLGPLARLGLGRSYVLQGDTAKARAAYQDFLTLWKDADPDLSVLKQAKTEYAKLQ